MIIDLYKLAYDLDRKGQYDMAQEIEKVMKSLAERVGINPKDMMSLADYFDSIGDTALASYLDELLEKTAGLTKTAVCPQCGNEEFGPGSVVCEDCGYPQVKDKREPAAKAKQQPEEFEWPHLVELAKTRAENPGKDIRVYPEDARTEEGKDMVESEGGLLWWCSKCDTYATPNRPCDCTSNTFGKESLKTEEEIQQRVSSIHLMSELVKIANQLDKDGRHEYASEIDSILFK